MSLKIANNLKEEVEKQLLLDLHKYSIKKQNLKIDWSEACQEGHCTTYLNNFLESQSSIGVIDKNGNIIAGGWMDFIHGGGNNPLFVFWLFLDIIKDGKIIKVKSKPNIPLHTWNELSIKTKELCTISEKYDSNWHKDPLVKTFIKNQ